MTLWRLALLAACTPQPEAEQVEDGSEFTLPPGESSSDSALPPDSSTDTATTGDTGTAVPVTCFALESVDFLDVFGHVLLSGSEPGPGEGAAWNSASTLLNFVDYTDVNSYTVVVRASTGLDDCTIYSPLYDQYIGEFSPVGDVTFTVAGVSAVSRPEMIYGYSYDYIEYTQLDLPDDFGLEYADLWGQPVDVSAPGDVGPGFDVLGMRYPSAALEVVRPLHGAGWIVATDVVVEWAAGAPGAEPVRIRMQGSSDEGLSVVADCLVDDDGYWVPPADAFTLMDLPQSVILTIRRFDECVAEAIPGKYVQVSVNHDVVYTIDIGAP